MNPNYYHYVYIIDRLNDKEKPQNLYVQISTFRCPDHKKFLQGNKVVFMLELVRK